MTVNDDIAGRIKFLRSKYVGDFKEIITRFGVHRASWHRYETSNYWTNINESIEKQFLLLQISQFFKADYIWLRCGTVTREITAIIVEDSATSRDIISFYLRTFLGEKAKIHSFADGESAKNWAYNNPADLVICDYHLPNTNGVEVTRFLRKLKHYSDIPIIMITVDGERIYDSCVEAGTDAVIYKPVSHQGFIEVLLRYVNLE